MKAILIGTVVVLTVAVFHSAAGAQFLITPPLLGKLYHEGILVPLLQQTSAKITLEEGPVAFGKAKRTILTIERPDPKREGPIGKGLDLAPKVIPVYGPGTVFLGKKGYVSGVGVIRDQLEGEQGITPTRR
jgi:hypothetical protein